MTPIHTYEVTVSGFSPLLYSARSPSKARMRCYRDFIAAYDKSFRDFLSISRVRLVPDPPGIGVRILVDGKPAIRVLGRCPDGEAIYFMRDDSDAVLCAHPLDVQPLGVAA